MAGFVATNWEKAPVSRWSPLRVRTSTPLPGAAPLDAVTHAPPTPVEDTEPDTKPEVDFEAALAAARAELAEERRLHAETRRARDEAEAAGAGAAASVDVEVARLRAATEALGVTRRRLVDDIREGVGHLVLAGARRLAGEGLRDQPGLVESLVQDAVASLGRDGLVVRVAPDDLARVTRALEGSGAQVLADPAITGGCTAATPFGSLDATVDTACAALERVVAQWQTAGWRAEEAP